MTSPTPAQLLTTAADRVRDRQAGMLPTLLARHLEAWLRKAADEYRSREGIPKYGEPLPYDGYIGPVDLTGVEGLGPSYWSIALDAARVLAPGEPSTTSEAGFFAEARPVPRYQGMSDPVPARANPAAVDMAKSQALHRMWVDWATSEEWRHWLPGPTVDVQVVNNVGDLFERNLYVIAASALGSPVYDSDELARMNAPLGVVRDDG